MAINKNDYLDGDGNYDLKKALIDEVIDGVNELEIEEGTWTPIYQTTGNNFQSITYAKNDGSYVKIGNKVTIYGVIRTANITKGSASGELRIGGLPFSASINTPAVNIGFVARFGTDFTVQGAYILTNVIVLAKNKTTEARSSVLAQDLLDGENNYYNYISFTASYLI